MDPNGHESCAASDPEQPADRSSAQPHSDGNSDRDRAVADMAGEFGAELVQASWPLVDLKNRPPGETRVVPLPPHLVTMWREHAATFGTADDGRLFFTEQGRIITYTTYNRVWHETRALALSPALASTPLAKRPYDLRHSALSTSINNQRIEGLLSAYDQPPEPDQQNEE
ncbi:hypothetical protein [Streptomyces sp. SP18BB07]|uniref:hypothetical protein n=1 Tax=Streptomyces sp. SP18BB07 TaxID=3002522 RepID=UPI002E7A91B1|nr:hypothetical protein [Streptomyces sp. SP18BB07]MEE1762709.1 hypothetical protein [Streptomyces sp. SP18BB07]